MPPKVRFRKETIVEAAYELARKKGLNSINARSVAAVIGCSTQPIFRVFENMEQLKEQVLNKAFERFEQYIQENRQSSGGAHKSVGMAYLLFAMEEPYLFHMVFLGEHGAQPEAMRAFACKEVVVQTLMEQSGFSHEQSLIIHRHMWVYTYGLAAILATGQLKYTPEELNELLIMEYRAIVASLHFENIEQYNPPA